MNTVPHGPMPKPKKRTESAILKEFAEMTERYLDIASDIKILKSRKRNIQNYLNKLLDERGKL